MERPTVKEVEAKPQCCSSRRCEYFRVGAVIRDHTKSVLTCLSKEVFVTECI